MAPDRAEMPRNNRMDPNAAACVNEQLGEQSRKASTASHTWGSADMCGRERRTTRTQVKGPIHVPSARNSSSIGGSIGCVGATGATSSGACRDVSQGVQISMLRMGK
ncbi:hypothetical protein PRNP1_011614 [Phytophthora ramorum]